MLDEDEIVQRDEQLGFRPQKENVYNNLLPYADKLDEESSRLFFDIKSNLIKSVLAREMRPGCALWTSRLNKYMKIYGLKFSKEDHIALIKLYYELLTIPDLEPTRINKYSSTLQFLLKKKYLLSQEDLCLDWRPLYKLCCRVIEKSTNDIGLYRTFSGLIHNLEMLIKCARIYFPASATQEILDEFRHRLCPYNADITIAIEYLEIFLPIVITPAEADIGYNLWLEEFMKFWEVCNNASAWENSMTWLMARLSSYTVGHINWEPYIPLMFVRFLRTMQLPVGYRQKQSGKLHKIDTSAMTLWIVCTLGGECETAFFHLEKFMQTLESYYHPANIGKWTPKIREVLRKLSYYLVQRVHCERHRKSSWDIQIPDSFKLTDAQIDRFINILKPSVEQAVFSRQGFQDVTQALQYLSSLRPNIIIPIVLDKMYQSMDSITEPHKLTSSMMCVVAVGRYMVQGAKYNYPEGPTHVIPLLMALLPGIDPNDIRKCFTTFNFISHFVSMCPLINSSEASKYHDLSEEEHIICEASAGFEDFVLQFFDRICGWVESNSLDFVRLEQNDISAKSKIESMAESALMAVITSVLCQCSPEIFTSALRKVHDFATNRILELKVSGKLVALLCSCFAKRNPKEMMKLFVPHLCDTIERLLAEHEDITKEENLGDELLYNMLLLSECTFTFHKLYIKASTLPATHTMIVKQRVPKKFILNGSKTRKVLKLKMTFIATLLCALFISPPAEGGPISLVGDYGNDNLISLNCIENVYATLTVIAPLENEENIEILYHPPVQKINDTELSMIELNWNRGQASDRNFRYVLDSHRWENFPIYRTNLNNTQILNFDKNLDKSFSTSFRSDTNTTISLCEAADPECYTLKFVANVRRNSLIFCDKIQTTNCEIISDKDSNSLNALNSKKWTHFTISWEQGFLKLLLNDKNTDIKYRKKFAVERVIAETQGLGQWKFHNYTYSYTTIKPNLHKIGPTILVHKCVSVLTAGCPATVFIHGEKSLSRYFTVETPNKTSDGLIWKLHEYCVDESENLTLYLDGTADCHDKFWAHGGIHLYDKLAIKILSTRVQKNEPFECLNLNSFSNFNATDFSTIDIFQSIVIANIWIKEINNILLKKYEQYFCFGSNCKCIGGFQNGYYLCKNSQFVYLWFLIILCPILLIAFFYWIVFKKCYKNDAPIREHQTNGNDKTVEPFLADLAPNSTANSPADSAAWLSSTLTSGHDTITRRYDIAQVAAILMT